MTLKIGDMVEVVGTNFCGDPKCGHKRGRICVIRSETEVGVQFDENIGGHNCGGMCPDGYGRFGNPLELQLINKNMSIKEKFVLAFLGEPEKSFRKTDITNGDGFLTTEGTQVFLAWLLKTNGDAFKKDVVDDLLADLEKED